MTGTAAAVFIIFSCLWNKYFGTCVCNFVLQHSNCYG